MDPCERFISLAGGGGGSILEKMWKNVGKWLFFRGDMAGLGIYLTGRYGRIEVYRVISEQCYDYTWPIFVHFVV